LLLVDEFLNAGLQIWHMIIVKNLTTFSINNPIIWKTEIFSGIVALAYISYTFGSLKDL